MSQRPVLKADRRVLPLEGDGVVLLSGDDERVLHGALYARLLPLLDGGREPEELARLLEPAYAPAEVFLALMELEQSGDLADPDQAAMPPSAEVLPLETRGIALNGEATTLVLTDSYLRPALEGVNAAALRTGHPWLLARSTAAGEWVGPLIRPGVTACWQCLEQRLRRNLPFEYLFVRGAGAALPVGRRDALARLVVSLGAQLEGTLAVTNREGQVLRREPVVRRPQCPACGDVTLYTRQARTAWVMTPQPRGFASDGGYRTVAPEQTVAAHRRLMWPLTGVVHDLGDVLPDGALPLPVAVARYGTEPLAGGGPLVGRGLRQASGKGLTAEQARASALGEAIERYSCVFQGDEPRRMASLAELGSEAIHPNDCMLYSDAQYDAREGWNRQAPAWHWVPPPLDPARRLDWTPIHSLATGERAWLPTMFLYSGYPAAGDEVVSLFDPSGNASGNCREEAVLQGLLELVERDALAIWWYNRIARPAVDLAASVPWGESLLSRFGALGRDLWMLELTTDLGVPAYAAVSRNRGPGPERLLLGFGAHLDPQLAMSRALTEMNQILAHVTAAEQTGKRLEASLTDWLGRATLADHSWLAPAPGPPRTVPVGPNADSHDLAADIRGCIDGLARSGLAAYVLDQTRPDIGVPVMKVVIPHLRHFRARFAPGRLFTVPVALGWLSEPQPESALNPMAFFL